MMKCAVRVGFILARPCGESALWYCAQCQQPVCPAHTRPAGAGESEAERICVACARSSSSSDDRSTTDTSSSSSTSSSSHTSDSSPSDRTNSSSDWSSPPAGTIAAAPTGARSMDSLETPAESNFSAEDMQAFDEAGDADHRADRSDLYDS